MTGFPGNRWRRLAPLARRGAAAENPRPEDLRRLVAEYQVGQILLDDGRVPLHWWRKADNFGDLMSPWLVSRLTGLETVWTQDDPHYMVIGSVLNNTNPHSVVWGAGSFGTENGWRFTPEATYTAVRGPLSRSRLAVKDIPCPEVYGDPALLAPAFFMPQVRKTHDYGIVARWSDRKWRQAELGPGVRLIDLRSADVEGVLEAILSCHRVVTGSLHGLIVADAYGIPSAWVRSLSAYGGPYKFFDYFATVDKFRMFQEFDTSVPVTASRLRDELEFDARPINFDYRALLDACPFLEPAGQARPVRKALTMSGTA